MKILFAGAGALGSRFGYMLFKHGLDVTFLDGWKDHVDKINEEGLRVIIDGKEEGTYKIPTFLPGDLDDKFDVIFVATKSTQLRPMMEVIKPLMKDTTKLICLLNGLGHVETLEDYVSRENILIGVTLWTSGLKGPGVLNATGSGRTEIKQVSEEGGLSSTMEMIETFNDAGLNMEYSDDVFESIWHKAGLNCVLNTFCTIIDCNVMEYGSYPKHQELTDQVLDEVGKVGRASGVNVDTDLIRRNIISVFPEDKGGCHYPSLYQDMKNGRLTEIDYLNGAISRMGDRLDIDTPICDLITNIVHAKEYINGNK